MAAVTATGILVAGCSRESGYEGKEDATTTSSLTITIENESGNGGGGTTSRAIGEPTQEQENTVNSFGVYVFDNTSGELEKSQTFENTLTGTISGLSTSSTKRIVVLVNYQYDILDGLTRYDEIADALLDLETQIPDDFSTNALFMSGETANVTLIAGQTNPVTVGVKRAVAKVKLGSLTVSPDGASRLDQFEIKGISMQNVPYCTYLLGDNIPVLVPGEYLGGLPGQTSMASIDHPELLYTAYTPAIVAGEELNPLIYFYVFPNDDSQGNVTLLTIDAAYQGNPAYYTFAINDKAVTGQTDGTFIKKNMIYTLNITLTALANYVRDPDDNDFADVQVTIDVEDWTDEIIQNVVW